jgi:2-keto-4-pentenoate hydratase
LATHATNKIENVAGRLREAERACQAVPPISNELGADDLAAAYAVQTANTDWGLANGRRIVGRKIGLTSQVVQRQLGVNQPDYGTLFADMEVPHGGRIDAARLIRPRVEAEIAFVLNRTIEEPDVTLGELMRSVEFAVAALEIVDSRIADWKIGIVDTVADNGSSARYVIGLEPRRLGDVDLEMCGMILNRGDQIASIGIGAACLGHPLKSTLWLAKAMIGAGTPLREGDLVLSGALGPMCDAKAGEDFEARIGGFSPVRVSFTG